MAFSITAELPLGVYRGHAPDGRVERIPSVVRLHSALLCAAGFGPRAQDRGNELVPCDADDVALRWLEDNPPDGVSVPALHVNRGNATAYRDDGTMKKSKGTSTVNKLAKSAGTIVAVGGRFVWTWSQLPPPEVVTALEALCPDVPHLGTAETPVRLTTGRTEETPTHVLDPDAGLFSVSGEVVELPRPGRVDELVTAHQAARRIPAPRSDLPSGSEGSASPVPPRFSVRAARYVSTRKPLDDIPWLEALVLPLDRAVPEREHVRWAVAAHRALIRSVGDGAPPLLTGVYPEGVARPVNRIALQLLDAGQPVDVLDKAPGALAVLLPRGSREDDVAVVLGALRGLSTLRGPGGATLRIAAEARYVAGEEFWRAPAPGMVRLWRTRPAAVPDTRGSGPEWTFAHAALLSLGFVWHGSTHLPRVSGRGDVRDVRIVEAVNDAGAAVVCVAPLRTAAVHDYVHRVHEHAVVRPYRATLATGALGGNRVVQAIGQTRHLGGGLLVPLDVPEGTTIDVIGAGR